MGFLNLTSTAEGQVQVMGRRAVNDVRDHLIAPEYVSY
jgi:hypothetical protein